MSRQLQTSLERSFSQADFDRFARLSGDDNPIHTDPEFSARSRFGRPVAHGLLLCSVLRGLIEELAPGGRLVDQSVMFPNPTYAGETMRFSVTVTGGEQKDASARLDCDLEVIRVADGVAGCQGQCRVMS
jgi:acyl dehydratase